MKIRNYAKGVNRPEGSFRFYDQILAEDLIVLPQLTFMKFTNFIFNINERIIIFFIGRGVWWPITLTLTCIINSI